MTWLAQFGLGSVQSLESPIVWEEQRSSYSPPSAQIPSRRSGVCRLGEGMVHFAGCAGLIVRVVVSCRSDANSVQNLLRKVRPVQFAYPIRPAASSFRSVRGMGQNVSPGSSFSSFFPFISRILPALHCTTGVDIYAHSESDGKARNVANTSTLIAALTACSGSTLQRHCP